MQMIKCDECGNYYELPSDATDRLERVRKAGSGSIYLKCPYCNETTSFNRFTPIFTNSSLPDKVDSKQNDIVYGLLPKKYEHCIEKKGLSITIRKEQYILYSINELFRYIDIDKNSYLQIYQLKGFAHTLESISEISNTEKNILDNALSIGEGNGSILFVEKGNKGYSLYVFYLDGAYIEALQITLDDIIGMI